MKAVVITPNTAPLHYAYDAVGNKLSKEIKDQSGNTLAKVDYIAGVAYLDGAFNQLFTAEGRVYAQAGAYFYEYFLKDHQANNRVAFGNLPERKVYLASLEDHSATYEQREFAYDPSIRTPAHNHTPLGAKSAALNGAVPQRRVGPAKVLNIASGDEVEIEVWAKYTENGWDNSTLPGIISVLESAFGATSAGTGAEAAFSSYATHLSAGTLGIYGGNAAGQPEAYLQYLFFDANHQYVADASVSNFQAVSSASSGAYAQLSSGKLTFDQPGYLLVYVVNESNQNKEVYFDDFKITHASSEAAFRVTQVNDYYPFGLPTSNSWRAPGYVDPGLLYQSSFAQYDSLTGYYDFLSRSYDPVLGRFFAVDPAGQFSSPYVGMGNIPHAVVDPDGEFITWSIGKGGFSIGFNLSPILIPLGAGVNVGWQGGFSAGPYGEIGYRFGGDGLGAGAAVQQGLSYNFSRNNLSTSTTALAYGSFGPFTAGGSVGANYDITNNQWSGSWAVSAGLGVGNMYDGFGIGVSYGSGGWGYGIGGYHRKKPEVHYLTADDMPQFTSEGDPVNYDQQTTNDFADEHFGYLKYRKKVDVLAKHPGLYDENIGLDGDYFVNNKTGERLFGATYPRKRQNGLMFLAKAAYQSSERLYFAMGHEFIHFGFARILNLPGNRAKHHASILRWEEAISNQWGNIASDWLQYHRSIYLGAYDPAYDLCAIGFCNIPPNPFR